MEGFRVLLQNTIILVSLIALILTFRKKDPEFFFRKHRLAIRIGVAFALFILLPLTMPKKPSPMLNRAMLLETITQEMNQMGLNPTVDNYRAGTYILLQGGDIGLFGEFKINWVVINIQDREDLSLMTVVASLLNKLCVPERNFSMATMQDSVKAWETITQNGLPYRHSIGYCPAVIYQRTLQDGRKILVIDIKFFQTQS